MESEDEEAAMAAAMGFAEFGKAPATKKRKYNSKTDAYIDGQELQNVDKGGKKGQGSGGNEVPLGRMRVLGESSVNEEQTARQGSVEARQGDVDEDRPMEERCLDTSRPPPADEKLKNDARRAARRGKPIINEDEIMLDDDEDDAEIAPTQSSGSAAVNITQRTIDDIVTATTAAPKHETIDGPASAPKPKQKQKQKPRPAQGLAAFMTALQTPVVPPPSIPPPPGTTSAGTIIPPAPGTASTNHTYTTDSRSTLPQKPSHSEPSILHSGSSPALAASGGRGVAARGQRNELWYVDYYDPSFNENPWKQLEKEHGLAPAGTWLDRPPRNR